MTRHETVPVTSRAALRRINRKLKPYCEQVRKTRGRLASEPGFGEYYQIDFNCNYIVDRNVDLEVLARELHVLLPWESVSPCDKYLRAQKMD